jgi:hypothetical protein
MKRDTLDIEFVAGARRGCCSDGALALWQWALNEQFYYLHPGGLKLLCGEINFSAFHTKQCQPTSQPERENHHPRRQQNF